jgi:alpha-L-fucosidase
MDAIVKFAKDTGFGYIVWTMKHQDGYCLWPTKASNAHSERDLLGEYVTACRKHGVKVGIYYSLFDLTAPGNEVEHLKEMLGNYGKIDYLFFDGYGTDRQEFDFPLIAQTIRGLQPDIILSNGYTREQLIFTEGEPDVGWIGTEKGIPEQGVEREIKCRGSKEDFSASKVRTIIPSAYVRTRKTFWFYSDGAVDPVKTVDELMNIYDKSYRAGCALVINVGPDKQGQIPEEEKSLLIEFHNSLTGRKNGKGERD